MVTKTNRTTNDGRELRDDEYHDDTNGIALFSEVQVSTIKSHVAEIKVHWNKSRDGIVELGKRLKTAKNDKSVTTHMFSRICADCGFTSKNADKLIAISESPRITSGQYKDVLPISYGTLYEIATLKQPDFENAIKNKVIHPDCYRKDIESLKKSSAGNKKKEHKENFKLMSVFIDNSNIDSDDEYLKYRNAVETALAKVDGVRLDFSSLDSIVQRNQKKEKRADVKILAKVLKGKLQTLIVEDGSLKKHEQKELFGDFKKPLEQVVHRAKTLKDKWKVDWRIYTVGTSIEQKCVGDIPDFNVKIAA